MAYIEFKNVFKIYKMGDISINALNDTNFTIDKGELVVILGPSGAGKTTCLNVLGGMDSPTRGEVIVDGVDVAKLTGKDLENVELAVQLCKDSYDPTKILENVGLKERLQNFPSQLSGGEQQRVAIARAIAKNPKILLCDEPTGALDYKTGKQILALLEHEARHYHITVIIITHNSAIAPMADKVIKFKNGSVEDVIINKTPKKVEEIEW